MTAAYQRLEAAFARQHALHGAMGILHWDHAAMMPAGAADARAEQLAVLAEIAHGVMTGPAMGEWLREAEAAQQNLNPWQQANLREMRHRWLHANAISADLVRRMTEAASASELCWRQARQEADFASFAPHLETMLGLTREMAQAKAEKLGCSAYDALLDGYDTGLRSAVIEPIFEELGAFLPGLITQSREMQARQPAPAAPKGPFSACKQKELGEFLMRRLGFDFDSGRLDESAHPFCGGAPGDVRLTTRYDENDMLKGLFGVLHETGHALYEQGLPKEWRSQPVGEALGMSLHESQSLLVEMQLSRSREFLEYLTPLLAQAFGADPAWESQNFYRLVTQVEPGFIRIHADEATYPCHILLRYRLEHALLAGDLKVSDLPGAWNEGMQKLLGITPPSDREGCLQDIHWSEGSFGYFPTYTLGAIAAAQWMEALRCTIPDLGQQIRRGEFGPLVAWLRKHIHAPASSLSMQELLRQATGKPLNTTTYKNHLLRRYLNN